MGSEKPRPVELSSHQEYWRGWFHGWHRDDDGKLVAVVEVNGSMKWVRNHYAIRFLDGKEPPKHGH